MLPTECRELTTLVSRLPVAIYRSTPDGRIMMANQAFADLLGYDSVAELLRLPASSLYADPMERDHVVSMFEDGTMPPYNEVELRRRDGTTLWVRIRSHAIDGAGGPRYYEGVILDITHLKEAEEQLRDSEEQFRKAFELSPIGMMIRNDDLRATAANAAICELLERTEVEVLASPMDELLLQPDAMMARQGVLGLLSGERDVYEAELRLITGTGSIKIAMVRATMLPRRTGRGKILGQFVDMTAERRMQQHLEATVQAKDRLVRSVSHELRTPLTTIVGFASELEENRGLDRATRQELVGHIATQSRDMADMVDDLLSAARDVSDVAMTPEHVDLTELCRVLLAGWRSEVALSAPEFCRAWVDAVRTRQIVRNLLTNAQRYGSPPVVIEIARNGERALIGVRDRGDGVPEESLEMVFEPYQRANTAHAEGVGLGLSVSRQLARKMGGELSYRREGGTTLFLLEIPSERPEGDAPAAASAEAPTRI